MHISLREIEFSYDETPVLKGISAEIPSGDLVVLVGPNGSGKSTLIKCINGILKIHKGRVIIGEKSISDYSFAERARLMAYVPQMEQKMVPITVFETVLLGRKPYINWKASEKDLSVTASVLQKLDLQKMAMRDVHKLSGGQQQRVFIARALAQQPAILLLDEPTANLDMKYQSEVLQLLRDLSAEKITVIVAMHDINMAALYARQLMMIKEGTLFAAGGRDIITAPNVEALFGTQVRILHNNGVPFVFPEPGEISHENSNRSL